MNLSNIEAVDEQLTAYLDGELSPSEATELERSLVDDERLRLRLAELRKAYDLLDELPETPHNQRFTQSTLEMVIQDLTSGKPSSSKSSLPGKRVKSSWWSFPKLLLLLAFCAILGAIAGVAYRFGKSSRDLRDIGLIASMPGLVDVNDLSMAIKLGKETKIIEVLRENFGDRLVPPAPDSLWQRRLWVEGLTPLQVAKLDSGRELLGKLDRDTYARLSAMESQIESRVDGKQIQEAVHLVGMVLDRLPNARRLDLTDLPSEQRFVFLREQLCFKAAMFYATTMPPQDTKAIEQWEHGVLRPELIKELSKERDVQTNDTRELVGMYVYRQSWRNGFKLDERDLLTELASTLSETGRTLLEGLNKNEQLNVMAAWLFPNRMNTTEGLIEGYEKLGKSNRDALDKLDLNDPQQSKRDIENLLRRTQGRTRRP